MQKYTWLMHVLLGNRTVLYMQNLKPTHLMAWVSIYSTAQGIWGQSGCIQAHVFLASLISARTVMHDENNFTKQGNNAALQIQCDAKDSQYGFQSRCSVCGDKRHIFAYYNPQWSTYTAIVMCRDWLSMSRPQRFAWLFCSMLFWLHII